MISRSVLALVCAALGLAGAGQAEQASGGLARSIEMPAHRALMALRARPDSVLAPFVSDGCSGGLSDAWHLVADQVPDLTAEGTLAPVFEPCCVTHDRAYHGAGGAGDAGQSYDARLAADRALRACVVAVGRSAGAAADGADPDALLRAYEVIAGAMYLAVRFGGAPCSGLPWRWGFGYPGCSVLGAGAAGQAPDD